MSSDKVIEVVTKGMCFFCLNPVQSLPSEADYNYLSSISGFDKLLRYLEVKFTQLVTGSREAVLRMRIDESVGVRVTLCYGCSLITEKFEYLSKQRQNENIILEIRKCVHAVHQVIKNGDESDTRVKHYRERTQPQQLNDVFNAYVADDLRRETLMKCSLKLTGAQRATGGPLHVPCTSGAGANVASSSALGPDDTETAGNNKFQENGYEQTGSKVIPGISRVSLPKPAKNLSKSAVPGPVSPVPGTSTGVRRGNTQRNLSADFQNIDVNKSKGLHNSPPMPLLTPQVGVRYTDPLRNKPREVNTVENSGHLPLEIDISHRRQTLLTKQEDPNVAIIDVENTSDSEDSHKVDDWTSSSSTSTAAKPFVTKSLRSRIPCPICQKKTFSSEALLEKHMLRNLCESPKRKKRKSDVDF